MLATVIHFDDRERLIYPMPDGCEVRPIGIVHSELPKDVQEIVAYRAAWKLLFNENPQPRID